MDNIILTPIEKRRQTILRKREIKQLKTLSKQNESLKEITIEMLKSNGYFAGELLWEFCEKHPEEFSLDYILGCEEKDITDEFERMLLRNEELKDYPL